MMREGREIERLVNIQHKSGERKRTATRQEFLGRQKPIKQLRISEERRNFYYTTSTPCSEAPKLLSFSDSYEDEIMIHAMIVCFGESPPQRR
jgi:hypothetical protein